MYRITLVFLLFATPNITLADSRKEMEEKVAKAIKEMASDNAKTRASAAEEVGKVAAIRKSYAVPAIEPLLKMLKDQDDDVRAKSADALAKIDEPKKTVKPLIELVKDDKSERVKIAAANGLGLMGEPARDAIRPLRETAEQARKDMKMQLAQACQRAVQNINGGMRKK